MKAVILAAGTGSRLQPLTANMPKALIKIGEQALLERQISCLEKMGFGKENIIIVAGFQSSKIELLYKNRCIIIFNDRYMETNNIYSIYLPRSYLLEGFLLLNGDIILEEKILSKVIDSKGSKLVVDTVNPVDTESMKVVINGDRIIEISKEIPIEKASGEYIGLMKLETHESQIFFKEVEKFVNNNKLEVWYEDSLNKVLDKGNFGYISTEGANWIEIDTFEDLKRAKKLFEREKGSK